MDPGASRILLVIILLAPLGMCSGGSGSRSGGYGGHGIESDYARCVRQKPFAHQWECER